MESAGPGATLCFLQSVRYGGRFNSQFEFKVLKTGFKTTWILFSSRRMYSSEKQRSLMPSAFLYISPGSGFLVFFTLILKSCVPFRN